MIRRKFHHIITKLKDIPRTSLREEERMVMRNELLASIRSESVPAEERHSMREGEIGRPAVPAFPVTTNRTKAMPVIILTLVVLLSGGTSMAAEAALPGDFLYPVKIHVNEEVRAALTFSAEADAEWEAERALRRLREAEELTAKKRLNAESRADIESRFEAHADRVEQDTMRLDAQSAARVRAKFQSELEMHERTLMELRSHGEEEIDAVLEIIGGTRMRIEADAATRTRDEGQKDEESDMHNRTDAEQGENANSGTEIRIETDADVDAESDVLDVDTVIRTDTDARIGL